MKTQRVNVYIVDGDTPVFHIEQYDPKLKKWFNIGGTYDKIHYAMAQVDNFNLKEIARKMGKIK